MMSIPGRKVTDHQSRLEKLIALGIALTSERDLDRLFDRILEEARGFTGAEAGTLYVVEKGAKLRFCTVQNDIMPAAHVQSMVAPTGGGLIDITRTSIAGYVASTGRLLNLRDVYDLPAGAEYRFNDWFDRRTNYRTRSMLAVPLKTPAGEVIGVLQLINGRDGDFDAEIEELVTALASQAAVALENAQLTAELDAAYQETIFRLARAAEFRDTDTGQHIHRVSHYAAEIARELGFGAGAIHDLILAVSMHDIGKIGLSDGILRKPAGLTPEERKDMENHTTYGAEILSGSDIPILMMSREIALAHHEKWDGTGYPQRLAGESIPITGRICALADVYDALTTKRCYKEAMPLEQACEIIRKGAGSHFDPVVTEAFFRVVPRLVKIGEAYSR